MILALFTGLFAFPSNVKAALEITGVTPSSISYGHETPITISGNDFTAGALASLDGYGSLSTSFVSLTTLTSIVPAGVPVGNYTLTITNPDLSAASLANALSVVQDTPTPTPTPTDEPPSNYERPVIVVDTYSLDQDTISPGNSFKLFITLYNAGQQYATNVVATFSSGDLIPRDTGGVVAVGEIAPGNHREFAQPLYLNHRYLECGSFN